MRIIAALAALGLTAACLDPAPTGAGGMVPASDPLPPEVLRNLPAGVARNDILVRIDSTGASGCYFYRRGDQVVPLSTPELRAAGFGPGQPYCVG